MAKAELIKHDYKSEADLCDMLTKRAKAQGWQVFPETGGHDLLLVATDKVQTINAQPGDHIGVQAKLHANIEVIAQAMPDGWGDRGPHYHAVLVPVAVKNFDLVARRCGILVMEATTRVWMERRWRRQRSIDHELRYLPPSARHYYNDTDWHPENEIWVPAGVKSPRKITRWKVKAVRFCLETLKRGFATMADLRREGISEHRWKQEGWLVPTGERIGRLMKYRLAPEAVPPHLRWPEITEVIQKEMEESEVLTKKQQRDLGITR